MSKPLFREKIAEAEQIQKKIEGVKMTKKEVVESIYTTRWYLTKAISEAEKDAFVGSLGSLQQARIELDKAIAGLSPLIKNLKEEKPIVPPASPKEALLWYPKAKRPDFTQAMSGKYRKGYPEGMVVHWVRAPRGGDPEFWSKWGKDQGLQFMTLGEDGTVVQAAPLSHYGAHAGESKWSGLGERVSQYLVGVEVVCEGKVEKQADGTFKADGRKVTNPVRYIPANKDNIAAGYYEAFSPAQENSLIELCLWLKRNNPDVFSLDLVLGHDEVAGPKGIGRWRKVDPGGSLSMTMTEFRELLKSEYKKRYG